MGERTGLDYPSVVAVARWMDLTPDVMSQVRQLELGAMTAYTGKEIETILYG